MRTNSWQGRVLIPALCSLVLATASWSAPIQQTTSQSGQTPVTATPAKRQAAATRTTSKTTAKTTAKTKTAAKPRTAKSKSRTAKATGNRLDLKSSSVLVVDEADSSVLYARHEQRVAPVASITKLMTSLVALEAGQPLDEILEITAADRDTEHGSASRLLVGTRLSRGDLLHLALMSSENRAAHAVARNYPGGLDAFIHAMNAKARALGMTTAHFVDPTGLSSENVSSAADLAKLVIAASADPLIQSFSTNESYTVAVGRHQLEFRNTNSLVTKPDWQISVQKTGYTQAAGRCLVMKALIQNRSVVIVLLNSVGKYTRVADARRIRRWMEAMKAPALLAGATQADS